MAIQPKRARQLESIFPDFQVMRSWLINSDCLDQSVACDELLAAAFSFILFAHSLFPMVLCQIIKKNSSRDYLSTSYLILTVWLRTTMVGSQEVSIDAIASVMSELKNSYVRFEVRSCFHSSLVWLQQQFNLPTYSIGGVALLLSFWLVDVGCDGQMVSPITSQVSFLTCLPLLKLFIRTSSQMIQCNNHMAHLVKSNL